MVGSYLIKYLVNSHAENITERKSFNSPKVLGAIQAAHLFSIWTSLHARLNNHDKA